jgi:hypothetical protein
MYQPHEISEAGSVRGLVVGHPVSLSCDGEPIAFHASWHVFMPDGEGLLSIIGPAHDTLHDAVAYAWLRNHVECVY